MGHDRSVAVAMAADEAYALPLAVSLTSLAESLPPRRAIEVLIFNQGLDSGTRERVAARLPEERIRVSWCTVPSDIGRLIEAIPSTSHVSTIAFVKLFLPLLIPSRFAHCLWLDADTVVRKSILDLLKTADESKPLQAVTDSIVQTIGSPFGIKRYREIGLRPDLPYFNSGVMLIDLEAWRAAEVTTRSLEYLKRFEESRVLNDQEALNAILAESWFPVDTRWNLLVHERVFATGATPPSPGEVERAWILHFVTRNKPWHEGYSHGGRRLFFSYVDQTSWHGWRP